MERKYIQKNSQMKDTLTKMKNTLQGINCRVYKAEGQAGNVEDKEIENAIL